MDVVRSSGMLSARNASQLAGVEGETAQFRYESGITAYRDRNGNTIASSYPLQIIWDSNTDSTVLLPLLLLSGFEVRFVNGSSRGSDGSNTVGASSANFTSTKAAASEAAKRYNSYSLKNSGALVVPSLNPTELHGAAYAGYYYGVRCELCSPGTGRNLEVCEACPPAETNTYILILYGFLGFCVVSGMVGTTMLAGHSRVHHEHKLQEKVVRHSDVEFRLRQMLTGCDSGAVPNHKLETTATAKIAVNYMQLTSLAKQIPMRWPGPIQNMLDLQEKFSSPNLQVASVECALRASAAASGGGSTFFSKFRLIMLLPPAAIVGSAIVWYSWYLFSRTSVHEACVGQYYRSRIGSMRRRLLKMRLESTPEKVEAAEEKLARFRMRAAPKTAKQKWETATARFIVTVLVLLFFCHSTLTKYLFAVFTCEEIDEVEYLKIDLEVVCGQGEHAVISSVAFVLLFVYSFGIPMVGYLVLRKNIKDITFRATAECPLHHARSRVLNQFKDALGHRGLYFKDHSLNWLLWGEEITPCTCRDRERRALSDRLIARLGFLFNGFKKQGMCPYWEVLPVMLRKVCFLLIVVRCQDYPIIIQALMALLLVFVALVVHVAHCPYELSALNSLELTSLLTSFFTLAAGVFFLIPETPPHWLTAIIVFVLVINAVTCVRLVFKLISSLVMFLPKHWRQNLFRFMPCMRAHNAFVRRQHRKIDGKGNKLSTVAPLSRGFGVTAVKGWSKLRCHNAEGDLVKMLKRSSGNGEVHVLDTLKEVAEAMIAPIGRTQPLASQLRDSCVDMRTALTNANLWHKHAPLSLDVTALDSAAECVVHAAFASARAIPPPIHLKACSRALSLLEVRFNCGPRPPTLSDSQSSTLSTSQSKTTIEVRALAELRSPSHPLAVPGADGSGAAVPGVRAPDAVPLKPAGHRMSTFESAIASAAAETWIRHMEAVKMEEGWAHPEPEIWLMDLVARAGEVLQVLAPRHYDFIL